MPSKGWLNLEAATGVIPENQFFEGESAFASLKMSRTTRLYGFGGCLAVGFVLSIIGAVFLFFFQLITFALFYGLGTVVTIIGTGFLIGFLRQLKLMFKPVRVAATIVFFLSIGLIFFGAFFLGSGVLCIIFVIIQFLAYTWYTLSYIPYARTAVLKMIGMG